MKATCASLVLSISGLMMLDLPILCKGCPQEASGFQDYAVCQFDWCHPGVKHVCLERGLRTIP